MQSVVCLNDMGSVCEMAWWGYAGVNSIFNEYMISMHGDGVVIDDDVLEWFGSNNSLSGPSTRLVGLSNEEEKWIETGTPKFDVGNSVDLTGRTG